LPLVTRVSGAVARFALPCPEQCVEIPPMKNFLMCLGAAVILSGCVSPSVPQGYSGATATIKDSVVTLSRSKGEFYCVEKIDGRAVENSVRKTRMANAGRGMLMEPQIVEREVPAEPVTLTITGATVYAADIQALLGKNYRVSGDVRFEPKPNGKYVVKGQLGPAGSTVWLVDEVTGRKVSAEVSDDQ
jgi:hypothetical protein